MLNEIVWSFGWLVVCLCVGTSRCGLVWPSERTKLSPLFDHFFEPKPSMWEALGLHFGTLGLDFGVFLEALTPLGPSWTTLGESIKNGCHFVVES